MENRQYDMNASVSGRWQGSSIRWYERASIYTGYHKMLYSHIAGYLSPNDTICEIAAGSGSFSRELAKHVSHVFSNEINLDAILYMKERNLQKGIDNITLLPGDWKEACINNKFDIVVYSYFSALLNDFELLKSITDKYIVAILPEDNKDSRHPHRETVSVVDEMLKKAGAEYTIERMTVDFGQPFDNREEARMYLRHYYNFTDDKELESFIDKKLKPLSSIANDFNQQFEFSDENLYFPKIKDIGIVVVDANF